MGAELSAAAFPDAADAAESPADARGYLAAAFASASAALFAFIAEIRSSSACRGSERVCGMGKEPEHGLTGSATSM